MKKVYILLMIISTFACNEILMAQKYHYPVPPDSIYNKQARVDYMIEHFWYEQSLGDTALFKNPKLILDYLYLLRQTSDIKNEKYIRDFVSLASKQTNTIGIILWWLDNILYDSSSPYYDENIYLKFLEEIIVSDIDSAMKIFPIERINILKKNQIGKVANNFTFIDKQNREHKLNDINTPLLMLIFNNPDCSMCNSTEYKIKDDKIIQQLIKDSILKILAITPYAEYDNWIKHKYPKEWISGFDKNTNIYNQRLYDIQRFPSIYLLDDKKRVLLKEADYERLCNFLPTIIQDTLNNQ